MFIYVVCGGALPEGEGPFPEGRLLPHQSEFLTQGPGHTRKGAPIKHTIKTRHILTTKKRLEAKGEFF